MRILKKKKIEKLQEKIADKIAKKKKKIKETKSIEEENRLKEEIDILKKFKKQLENKI